MGASGSVCISRARDFGSISARNSLPLAVLCSGTWAPTSSVRRQGQGASTRSNSLFGQARLGLQWLLHRSGPLAVGINQGGCFMRALPDEADRPDIQFHVATLSADMAGGKVHPLPAVMMAEKAVDMVREDARQHGHHT